MDHPVFGKMRFREDGWKGHAPLPLFAVLGRIPDAPEAEQPTPEEEAAALEGMQGALDAILGRVSSILGPQAADMFKVIDREHEKLSQPKPLTPKQQERERKEAERERKREEREAKARERLARGLFPVRLADEAEEGPTGHQAAAYSWLIANERAAVDAVRSQVWASFQEAYSQEYWRNMAGLTPAADIDALAGKWSVTGVTLTREYHQGKAYLIFDVDSSWRDEHGLVVVVHPDKAPEWSTYDGMYDLTESDEPVDETEYEDSPALLLVFAIERGDEAEVKRLVAEGADINAVDADDCPPLWVCVDQLEDDNVEKLLRHGADPRLAYADEKSTPLKHARKLYRDMGFAPRKKKDSFLDGMMQMVQGVAGGAFAGYKAKLERIIAMLEKAEQEWAAGG